MKTEARTVWGLRHLHPAAPVSHHRPLRIALVEALEAPVSIFRYCVEKKRKIASSSTHRTFGVYGAGLGVASGFKCLGVASWSKGLHCGGVSSVSGGLECRAVSSRSKVCNLEE
jgi:hypothetical protein